SFPTRRSSDLHPRRRLLDEAQGVDDLERHLLAWPEGEIPDRTLCLRSPIGVRRDLNRAEAVGLGTGVGHCFLPRLFFPREIHIHNVRPIVGLSALSALLALFTLHRRRRI